MTIHFADDYLCDDNVGYNYMTREMIIRGTLRSDADYKKSAELRQDIDNAFLKWMSF